MRVAVGTGLARPVQRQTGRPGFNSRQG